MKTVVVLAMHDAPPNDFPKRETDEMFGLHAHLEVAHFSALSAPTATVVSGWTFLEMPYSQFKCWRALADCPQDDTKLDLSKVTMIDFAFSNKKGGTPGSGRVTMDEIRATY